MKLAVTPPSLLLAALLLGGCGETTAGKDSLSPPSEAAVSPPSPAATPSGTAEGEDDERSIYRVLYTGKLGASAEDLRQQALEAAAKTTRDLGYEHFAVVEERSEPMVGSASGVTASIAIKRSQRRTSSSSRGGSTTTIPLGQPRVPAYLLRIVPFTDLAPENAISVHRVEAYP